MLLFKEKTRQSWTAGWKYPPDSGAAKGGAFGYQRMPSSSSVSGTDDISKTWVAYSMDDIALEKGKKDGTKFTSS